MRWLWWRLSKILRRQSDDFEDVVVVDSEESLCFSVFLRFLYSRALNVWTSYECSIYVLCLRGYKKVWIGKKKSKLTCFSLYNVFSQFHDWMSVTYFSLLVQLSVQKKYQNPEEISSKLKFDKLTQECVELCFWLGQNRKFIMTAGSHRPKNQCLEIWTSYI